MTGRANDLQGLRRPVRGDAETNFHCSLEASTPCRIRIDPGLLDAPANDAKQAGDPPRLTRSSPWRLRGEAVADSAATASAAPPGPTGAETAWAVTRITVAARSLAPAARPCPPVPGATAALTHPAAAHVRDHEVASHRVLADWGRTCLASAWGFPPDHGGAWGDLGRAGPGHTGTRRALPDRAGGRGSLGATAALPLRVPIIRAWWRARRRHCPVEIRDGNPSSDLPLGR
jgi:hypothetical protein